MGLVDDVDVVVVLVACLLVVVESFVFVLDVLLDAFVVFAVLVVDVDVVVEDFPAVPAVVKSLPVAVVEEEDKGVLPEVVDVADMHEAS